MFKSHSPLNGLWVALFGAALLAGATAVADEHPAPLPIKISSDDDSPSAGSSFDRLFPPPPSDFLWWLLSTEGPTVSPEAEMRYVPYPSNGPPGETGPDGTWSMLPPPGYYGSAGIFDPVRDRMLVIGGAPPYGDGLIEVWSLSLSGANGWERIAVAGTPPPGRTYHTTIYDPLRDRVILFGGNTRYGAYWTALDDVWALNLSPQPTWSQLLPSGLTPGRRLASSAVYDPVRDRMLIYGGRSASYRDLGDVWQLALSSDPAWSLVLPTGSGPGERSGIGMVYDPANDRVVLTGGFRQYESGRSDVWALSLEPSPTWTLLAPGGGPSGHYDQRVLYDPDGKQLVAFVGYKFPYEFQGRSDIWSFPLGAASGWSRAAPGTAPVQRYAGVVTHDTNRRRLLMCMGWDHNATPYGGEAYTDAWAWSLEARSWEDISPTGTPPPQRMGHTATYDPIRGRMIVIGGYATGNRPYSAAPAGDVWALSLAAPNRWEKIVTQTALPPRTQHSAIYDSERDRIVVFGGTGYAPNTNTSIYLDDAWSLSLAGAPEWTRLTPAIPGPGPRMAHSAIYDPGRDRMVVYGGRGGNYFARFDDLWTLSFPGTPTWTRLAPGGDQPPGRLGHTATYDPVGNRMVVFGGQTTSSGGLGSNEVFALRLNGNPIWEAIAVAGPRGSPAGRLWHGATYDALRRRIIVMGGLGETYNYLRLNDIWQLSLQGQVEWIPLDTGPSGPRYRSSFGLIYDPVRDRAVQSAGNLNIPLFFDTWFLDFPPAQPGSVTPSVAGERNETRGETGTELTLEATCLGSGHVRVSGGLGREGAATVAVLDVAGRRIASRKVSSDREGFFVVDLGLSLPSGIYFIVLREGKRQVSTKTVALR